MEGETNLLAAHILYGRELAWRAGRSRTHAAISPNWDAPDARLNTLGPNRHQGGTCMTLFVYTASAVDDKGVVKCFVHDIPARKEAGRWCTHGAASR